jgi:hypothetical protein
MIYNEYQNRSYDLIGDCNNYVIRERKCEVPFSELKKY